MAMPLTPAEHEQKMWAAYRLSLRGWHGAAIAAELQISRQTVVALLKQAKREIAKDRKSAHDDLGHYLAEMDQDRRASYEEFDHPTTPGTAKPGHMANATSAATNKAKVLGLFVEKHEHEHSGSIDLLMKALTTPQTIVVPDPPDTAEFE